MKIQRALLSVSDKTGLADLARGLAGLGVELLSTGGTAATLREAGVSVTDVSAHTGHPEILDGRVKTLHPKVHGGILQRRAIPADADTCARLGIPPIDLVCVNLYPFEQSPSIETMDIGGPAMLRSAAKNHADVIVLCDPADYPAVLAALQRDGDLPIEQRRALARKAFARTAAYDAAIAAWLAGEPAREIHLRYGENPHQTATFRPDTPPPAEATLAAARFSTARKCRLTTTWTAMRRWRPPGNSTTRPPPSSSSTPTPAAPPPVKPSPAPWPKPGKGMSSRLSDP
jgi:phosphoribosylaminoimidazolecarboxamide formyltransferase/IMP cyclohydrolase